MPNVAHSAVRDMRCQCHSLRNCVRCDIGHAFLQGIAGDTHAPLSAMYPVCDVNDVSGLDPQCSSEKISAQSTCPNVIGCYRWSMTRGKCSAGGKRKGSSEAEQLPLWKTRGGK